MKTKRIYTAAVCAVLLFAAAGCADFLDRAPLDQMSSETFWQSEADVEMALTGCYRRLRDEQYFGWKRVDLDCLTDNAQQRHNHGAVTDISRGVIEKMTGGIISSVWGAAYRGINTCNYFLDNIDRVTNLDEGKKNRYIAEVRFLRAFFYFELVHFFGDVPLYRNVPTVETASVKQSPKAEVLALIHEDLNFAIQHLPDVPYTDGHVVKGSAQGYMARILLYEEQFAEAAALCKEIIDGGNFQLSTSYDGMFITTGQTNNPEIMFSTRYLAPDDYTEMDIQVNWWSSNNPRQAFVDAYQTTGGMDIDAPGSGYDPENPYENRDPRLGMTVMLKGEVWLNPDGSPYTPEHTTTGYRQKKYIDPTIVPIDYATRSDQDYVHLRFADVLLMYAEAQNEANGPDQSVADAVNRVRGREGVGMPPVAVGASKAAMRETIRHERRIELALEGLRYFDLKRWHIAHEVMPQVQDAAGVNIRFDNPKHYLWPYQQSELDINPNLEPNPNYE